eukprot:7383367-Prymnesium_polylepis.1
MQQGIRRGATRCESMPGTPCIMGVSGGNSAAACGIIDRRPRPNPVKVARSARCQNAPAASKSAGGATPVANANPGSVSTMG